MKLHRTLALAVLAGTLGTSWAQMATPQPSTGGPVVERGVQPVRPPPLPTLEQSQNGVPPSQVQPQINVPLRRPRVTQPPAAVPVPPATAAVPPLTRPAPPLQPVPPLNPGPPTPGNPVPPLESPGQPNPNH